MENLTKKQQGFVKDYVETGNGTQAALKNYDTDSPNVANQIALDNLRKPTVIEAIKGIAQHLDEETLAANHKKLFEQVRVEYFVFPKTMEDEEIVAHVKAAGIDVITIRPSDKGKMAFYSIPDSNAIKSGLDMAYKIKGTYAAESSTINIGKIEAILVKFIDGKDNRDTNGIPKAV